jgi:hypothetical protein
VVSAGAREPSVSTCVEELGVLADSRGAVTDVVLGDPAATIRLCGLCGDSAASATGRVIGVVRGGRSESVAFWSRSEAMHFSASTKRLSLVPCGSVGVCSRLRLAPGIGRVRGCSGGRRGRGHECNDGGWGWEHVDDDHQRERWRLRWSRRSGRFRRGGRARVEEAALAEWAAPVVRAGPVVAACAGPEKPSRVTRATLSFPVMVSARRAQRPVSPTGAGLATAPGRCFPLRRTARPPSTTTATTPRTRVVPASRARQRAVTRAHPDRR